MDLIGDYIKRKKGLTKIRYEHPLLEDAGNKAGNKGGVRAPSPENGQGMVASGFPLLRLGSAATVANTPEKRRLLDRREELEREIDRLKYEKAALPLDDYKKKLGSAYTLARFHHDLVDVHVPRARDRPHDAISDVVRGQRIDSLVDRRRFVGVALEADDRELRLDHPGVDSRDPDGTAE